MELPNKSGQIYQNGSFDQVEASSVTDEEAQMLQGIAKEVKEEGDVYPHNIVLDKASAEVAARLEDADTVLRKLFNRQ